MKNRLIKYLITFFIWSIATTAFAIVYLINEMKSSIIIVFLVYLLAGILCEYIVNDAPEMSFKKRVRNRILCFLGCILNTALSYSMIAFLIGFFGNNFDGAFGLLWGLGYKIFFVFFLPPLVVIYLIGMLISIFKLRKRETDN